MFVPRAAAGLPRGCRRIEIASVFCENPDADLQKHTIKLTCLGNFCKKTAVFTVKIDRQPTFNAQAAPELPGSFQGASGSFQGVKSPAPKRPLRARQPEQGLEKFKKANFQLPKGPCGHDIRGTELETLQN